MKDERTDTAVFLNELNVKKKDYHPPTLTRLEDTDPNANTGNGSDGGSAGFSQS
jgi:hypothetical protein